jgi:hypothetical protein
MRKKPLTRFPLPLFALLFLSTDIHATLEYRVKKADANLFQTQELVPPPIAVLPKGEPLILIHKGSAASMVKTQGEIKGWMRNGDVEAVKPAKGRHVRLNEQEISGLAEPGMILIDYAPSEQAEILAINRSFADEIIEAADREQLEMRHDEN